MIDSISHHRMFMFQMILASLIGFIMACQPAKIISDCSPPTGKYINATILDKCPEMMPADLPHFCFEIRFRSEDTVELNNGIERFSLKYSTTGDGCSYTIHGASLFGDMVFMMDSDSTLKLVDTAWTKLGTSTSFKKLKPFEESGFETLLNECMITGEYALFDHGSLRPGVVTILANGQLNGFKPYLGYELCYAGDCLEETSPPARTINLIDDQGKKEAFVFKNIEGKMAIELYSIGPAKPDIKGERSIGLMVYELRTE